MNQKETFGVALMFLIISSYLFFYDYKGFTHWVFVVLGSGFMLTFIFKGIFKGIKSLMDEKWFE